MQDGEVQQDAAAHQGFFDEILQRFILDRREGLLAFLLASEILHSNQEMRRVVQHIVQAFNSSETNTVRQTYSDSVWVWAPSGEALLKHGITGVCQLAIVTPADKWRLDKQQRRQQHYTQEYWQWSVNKLGPILSLFDALP